MMKESLAEIVGKLRREGTDDSHYEVKECAKKLSSSVWETVSAFANTSGGAIILGVSEKDGFSPVKDFAIDEVCNQFVSGMGDGGERGLVSNPPRYTIERDELEGANVLLIRVEELLVGEKPCYITARGVQNGSYKRIDDKDVRLSSNEVYLLQTALTVDGSDREPVQGATREDLDETAVDLIIARAQQLSPRSLRGAEKQVDKEKRLNLLNSNGEVMRSGLLVAGVYPQQFYPKLHVDVAAHPGTGKGQGGGKRFIDRMVCEGTIGEMVETAVAATTKNLRRTSEVSGVGRIDALEIPPEVLREAIANALVHRSYHPRFDGTAVTVDIFVDRIEITNPGGLWGKTKEELADGRSCCRNPTLMKLMSYAPLSSDTGASLVEGNGGGIGFMIDELTTRGLESPEFRPGTDSFKVILHRQTGRPSRSASVKRGEIAVEALLKKYGTMSAQELVEKTGMTVSQVRRRLADLIDSGQVVATAPVTSRNRKYRVSE